MLEPGEFGRRVKLHDLHVFLVVLRAGSMGKAAKELNTVQPAVSRAIAQLEGTLGVRLLDRFPHGVQLTDHGRAMRDCVIGVFDELREGAKSIAALEDPAAGELRIGSIAPVAGSFVARVVESVARRHPGLTFTLTTGHPEALHRALHERAVDLLVSRSVGFEPDPRLNFEPLFADTHVVVAGPRSKWARRRRLSLSDLSEEAWVFSPEDTVTGRVAREAFRASGIAPPRRTVITDLPEVRLNLLSTGRFLAVAPRSILRFALDRPRVSVLDVDLHGAPVPIGLVTIKKRSSSLAARLFMDEARVVARVRGTEVRSPGRAALSHG